MTALDESARRAARLDNEELYLELAESAATGDTTSRWAKACIAEDERRAC